MKNDCLFCRIASGDISVHMVDEDTEHMAFLTIYLNTPGCTVVMPRVHHPSYFAECEPAIVNNLMLFARRVVKILDASFEDYQARLQQVF